jgi:hypothetical protein
MNVKQISAKKQELITRVTTPGYQTTARDAAEAAELVNAYIDELERLEKTAKPYAGADIHQTAESILRRWYPS